MTACLLQPQLIDKHSKSYWTGLYGSSIGLAISSLSKQQSTLILIVTEDSQQANSLRREIQCFLGNNNEHCPLLNFPDWETLPYDHFSPHQDIIAQRLQTLCQLNQLQQGIIITPVNTLLQRIAPADFLAGRSLVMKKGDSLNLQQLRNNLQQRGYYSVNQVREHGEYSLRGSIFDIYPMGSRTPYRIDLFDDQIDSIRLFDPETQRSEQEVDSIDTLPAKEFPLDDEAVSLFRQRWRDYFTGNPSDCPIYQDISKGLCPAGIEYYLPFFFEQTASLINYIPATTCILRMGNTHEAGQQFFEDVNKRFAECNIDRTRPLIPPQQVFYQMDEIEHGMKEYKQIIIDNESTQSLAIDYGTTPPPSLQANHHLANPLQELCAYIDNSDKHILLCAESPGRREALLTMLHKANVKPTHVDSISTFLKNPYDLAITIAPLDKGASITDPAIDIISESQLFGEQVLQQRRRKQRQVDSENIIRNLAELTIGSAVVHIDYGVGRYLGLQTLDSGDYQAEYLTLEYAGKDKLYVPISSLHLISRYSGVDIENAPLHQLGTNKWQKAKEKAAKQVTDVAAELLDLYARRAARTGHVYQLPQEYHHFSAAFPFEETPDQEQAIDNVVDDMTNPKPMDRLVCGDVGFGKTEVAMRAAFIAVQNNKQVAVLVPTTLLAQQHYESFCDRFADYPMTIEVISRFRTAKEQQQVLDNLAANKVDIIIGTHKLIQEKVKFSELGLVILDEEHRFGVKQKERLKALRSEVDILTLTATPIPRTLNMAMSGMRDLSIIATPPAKRLAIKTFVHERNNGLIREAINREILRGGQVYFVHNKVETIARIADELATLVPEARIGIGHGQMRERELEQVMSQFYHQRFNVLVCTTIIETGIDIPSANTIIIDRADRFGLAQLHQLRGRVGRSHHQAYAYLMTPNKKAMTRDAKKRLDAISSLEDLGVGFTLASHDLEIRGAGELLGDEQSGNIQAIGLTMYTELLDRAVKALKSGKSVDDELYTSRDPECDLKITSLIPEDYIGDVHTRLMLYKRLANATSDDQVADLQVEIIDRFGLLPAVSKNLFKIKNVKLQAKQLGISKIDTSKEGIRFDFHESNYVDPIRVIQLIQQKDSPYRLLGSSSLLYTSLAKDNDMRIEQVTKTLELLSAK